MMNLDGLFSSVLDLQLCACYVILLVLFLRFFLRKQPKIYSYALWSVVLFRLLCPFRFETVLSLIPREQESWQTHLPQIITTQTAPAAAATTTAAPSTFDLPTIPVEPAQTVTSFQWSSLLPYLWLAGIIVLLLYSIIGLWKLQRGLRGAEQTEDGVYEVSGLETAFVFGFVHPKIYLPTGLSAEEREYILLHERSHLRRGDHLIKIASFAALCIHWFNPLVWLAFVLSAQDMEMSCDEAVIAHLGSDVKKAYSRSLLSLAVGKRLLRATPLAFGEGDTKVRIKNILNYKKPSFWVTIILMAVVVVAGIGLASDPVSEQSDVADEEATELMQMYFPSPYVIEAGAEKNVVGDERDDLLYTVYLDVNKAISARESAIERRQMFQIAVDGSNRDIWKQQDEQWVLYHDYIEVDYETLWSKRTEYIGDNSKVSQIAGNLPYPDDITYEGISIQSSKEPYTLTINLTADSKEDMDALPFQLENEWELILGSLIGNLGRVELHIEAGTTERHSTHTISDNSEDFAASATLEGFINMMESDQQTHWRVNAESMLEMTNMIENIKRAAIYYMEWPEGASVESLKYGADWLTYGMYSDIGLSGMTVPQTGSAEEQRLRSNAAAMMEAFSCSVVSYQFDSGESLEYSNRTDVGINISEEEIAAEAEQAAFLKNIAEGNIPQEESTAEVEVVEFIFPLKEEDLRGISAQYDAEKHEGVDFIAAEGADILAVADGIVTTAEYDGEQGKGFYVRVEHSGGYESICAHCSELLVSVGQQVKAGDVIAKVGSTGLSTGAHLHFKLSKRVDGSETLQYETVDPMFYLGQLNEPFLFPLPQDSGYRLQRAYDKENNYNPEKSGVDFAVAAGTDILAVRDGTVKSINTWRSKGKQILIYHGQGWYATYNHCGEVLVEAGQEVTAGEVIASVAEADGATQSMFNFELGQSWNKKTVDPMEYLIVPQESSVAFSSDLTNLEFRGNSELYGYNAKILPILGESNMIRASYDAKENSIDFALTAVSGSSMTGAPEGTIITAVVQLDGNGQILQREQYEDHSQTPNKQREAELFALTDQDLIQIAFYLNELLVQNQEGDGDMVSVQSARKALMLHYSVARQDGSVLYRWIRHIDKQPVYYFTVYLPDRTVEAAVHQKDGSIWEMDDGGKWSCVDNDPFLS